VVLLRQQNSSQTGGSIWQDPRTAAPLESIGVLASLQLELSWLDQLRLLVMTRCVPRTQLVCIQMHTSVGLA